MKLEILICSKCGTITEFNPNAFLRDISKEIIGMPADGEITCTINGKKEILAKLKLCDRIVIISPEN